jgi:hypothetical protein
VLDALAAGDKITVPNAHGDDCELIVRKANVTDEMEQNMTGSLAVVWAMQEEKVAAATRIQAAQRGRSARRLMAAQLGPTESLRGAEPSHHSHHSHHHSHHSHHTSDGSHRKEHAKKWEPSAVAAVQNYALDVAEYFDHWLRRQTSAQAAGSSNTVDDDFPRHSGSMEEVIAALRQAVRYPSKRQLVALALIPALLVGLVVGIIITATSEDVSQVRRPLRPFWRPF